MDLRGFGDGVGEAAAAGFYARKGGGGYEGAGVGFELRLSRVEQPEVGFDVVGEAFVLEWWVD